ncbi:hypothetical protein [Labrys wisconsinensis]|uniref:ATP dependent DNA ligase n=1 Tax=Labrys wisconsinensis TaxID=425677 RepID=UPI00351FE774
MQSNPVRVTEIEYRGRTHEGHLRHPSFKGLREEADVYVTEGGGAAVLTWITRIRRAGAGCPLSLSALALPCREEGVARSSQAF